MADPQRYLDEAKRLRLEAEAASSFEMRRQLLDIADQYERLAKSVAAAKRGPRQP
jgi:hypothetical protein